MEFFQLLFIIIIAKIQFDVINVISNHIFEI